MKLEDVTLEKLLIALILLLGAALRLLNLGQAPLSDGEATWALQALNIIRSMRGEVGVQPGLVTLTAAGFFLFGSSNFLARLLPAIAGIGLILTPVFFKQALGRPVVLVLMLGLAIDPGLVAQSRLAGSPMPALGFTALALGLAYQGRAILAGLAGGLALLSGPAVLQGALPLALAWGLLRLLERAGISTASTQKPGESTAVWLSRDGLNKAVITAAIVVALLGSLFFVVPQGLSGWAGGLSEYLRGWLQPSGIPALRLAAALVFYQPLALIFGVIGAARGWLQGKRVAQFLSLWLLCSFFLALIYPARQVGDMVWTLAALWALAALELVQALSTEASPRPVALGQALAILLLIGLFWLNLAGTATLFADLQTSLIRLAVLVGLLALGGILTILVSLGWSWDVARTGLVGGVCAGLGLYGISMLWSASQARFAGQYELWQPVPLTVNADLLTRTLQDLSEWNQGLTDSLDVTLAIDAPSLRWVLRNSSALTLLPEYQLDGMQGAPSVVIARLTEVAPSLAQAYRGQDFAWWESPAWEGALPPDFLRWVTTHQAPLRQEQVVLWARSDLFPDGELTLPVQAQPELVAPDDVGE